jgi:hypothetical protein
VGAYALLGDVAGGHLVRLKRGGDTGWVAESLASVAFMPATGRVLQGDSLLVVGHGGMALLSSSGRVVASHANQVWTGTNPSSVARDRHGVVYIGMHSAIARLVPMANGYRETWLVPAACPRREIVRPVTAECECRAS